MSRADRAILLLEDDISIAATLEQLLRSADYTIVGPAGSIAEALVQIVQQEVDAALVNIMVGLETSGPVLDVLASANIPFLFVSTHSSQLVPSAFRGRPFVSWPCPQTRILEQLERLLT